MSTRPLSAWMLLILAIATLASPGCSKQTGSTAPAAAQDEVREALAGPMRALEAGKPREAVSALLGHPPDAQAWKRTEKVVGAHGSRPAANAAAACAANLKELSDAIELYRADDAHGYRMPEKLTDLVGQNGLTALPTCPAARKDTYSTGYKPDFRGESFVLVCKGHYHADAGLAADMPRYDPRYGVLAQTGPATEAAWWPASWHADIESVEKNGDRAVVTLREAGADNRTLVLQLKKDGDQWVLDPEKFSDDGGSALGFLLGTYLSAQATPVSTVAVDRGECQRQMERVATALEAWSSDHNGRYPAKLQDLVPRYLPQVPVCSGEKGDTLPTYRVSGDSSGYDLSCTDVHLGVNFQGRSTNDRRVSYQVRAAIRH